MTYPISLGSRAKLARHGAHKRSLHATARDALHVKQRNLFNLVDEDPRVARSERPQGQVPSRMSRRYHQHPDTHSGGHVLPTCAHQLVRWYCKLRRGNRRPTEYLVLVWRRLLFIGIPDHVTDGQLPGSVRVVRWQEMFLGNENATCVLACSRVVVAASKPEAYGSEVALVRALDLELSSEGYRLFDIDIHVGWQVFMPSKFRVRDADLQELKSERKSTRI